MSYKNTVHQASKALKYYVQAKSIYQLHSPALYQLANNTLDASKAFYIQRNIETERQLLLASKEEIDFVEYGAGSINGKRKVAQIANSSLSSLWQCSIMFNLVEHLKPQTVLELGTSLGISSAYLAAAKKDAKIVSLEGNPSSAHIAKGIASKLNLNNLDIRIGSFDETLKQACDDLNTVDIAFLDGNHRKDPTIEYFELLLQYTNEKSVLIFDDIHWSPDMSAAWEYVQAHPRVTSTIDLFYFGIVILDPAFLDKQHISYIDAKYKPWQKYLSE